MESVSGLRTSRRRMAIPQFFTALCSYLAPIPRFLHGIARLVRRHATVKSFSYSIPGIVDSATETFYDNTSTTDSISDGALTSMALFSNSWLYYRYDNLSRLTERDVGNILTEHQAYLAGSGTCTTTTLPETFYTTAKGSSTKLSGFQYTYNAVGNVTRITNLLDNSYTAFAYDKIGQMQYATEYDANGTAQIRYKYFYDNAGNLTSWMIQNGAATVTEEEHTYTYGDANWKDLLTAFDGHTITYDGSGNPLSYYNGQSYTMTWRNGRELNTATVGGKTYHYEYDANGLRTRKTNADGGYTEYYIVDGITVAERRFTSAGVERYTMRYLLDENNSPIGFGMQYPSYASNYWENYYFAKNLQGDVIALYRSDYNSSTGAYYATLIATYAYDPWGNPTGIYNPNGTSIAQNIAHVAAYNPFRYRGYRYDADTGFYYLQSRYYDPTICRFINADGYASTGQGILGFNMFAYCGNNPAINTDPSGKFFANILINTIANIGANVAAISEVSALTVHDIYQIFRNDENGVVLSKNNDGSIKIKNSASISTPWMQFGYSFYVNHFSEYQDDIRGSTVGMAFEWFVHNVAYVAYSTIDSFGLGSIFGMSSDDLQGKMDQARDVDIGATIYADNHGGWSNAMQITYGILFPIPSISDRIIQYIIDYA